MAGGYASDKAPDDKLVALLVDLQRQVNSLRAAAGIKSAILRGDRFEFQEETAGDTTGIIGKFDAVYWNSGPDKWEADTLRGLALIKAGEDDPFLMVGHALGVNQLFLTAGHSGTPLNSIRLNAMSSQINGMGGNSFMRLDEVGYVISRSSAGAMVYLFETGGALIRPATNADTLYLGNGVGRVSMVAGTDVFINAAGNTGIYAGGDVSIDPTGELKFFITTTTTPANLTMVGNNVRVVSSGRKYKADIADAVIDVDDVLALRPRTWVDRGELERDPEYCDRTVGFIAEELDERETLRQFVHYDEAGDPQSVYYDRMTAALVPVVQQQQAEIAELRAMVAALGDRVAVLEERR